MAGNFLPPAIFEIKAIADEAIAKFKDVNNELEKMEGQAAKAGGSVDKMQQVSRIATAALIGMGTAFAGFAAVGIKEAQETEQVFTKLGVTLSNLGISSAATRAQVEELSGSYVKLGFGGDEAGAALNTLLNATGDLSESQKLLAVSADLARLKNIDLGTAASILGKASNGSTKAFKELGITLDESLPKSEALKKAMGELATQTGGQAIAFTQTFAGQLVVLKEQFKDSAESVGSFLLPKLQQLLDAFNSAIDFVKRNSEAFKIFAGIILTVTVALASYNIAIKVSTALTKAWTIVTKIQQAATLILTGQFKALNTVMKLNPIGLIVTAGVLLAGVFVMLWNKSETFRKAVIAVGKAGLMAFASIIPIMGKVGEAILKLVFTPLKTLLTALSHLPGVGKFAKAGLDILNKGLDGVSDLADKASAKAKELAANLDKLNKPITIGGPGGIKVPDFPNAPGGGTKGGGKTKEEIAAEKKAQEENDKILGYVKDLNEKVAAAQKKYNEQIAKAKKAHDEAVAKANAKAAEETLKAEAKKNEDTAKVNAEYQKKITEAQKTFNETMGKLNAKRADDLAKLEKDNAAKVKEIYKANAEKLQDIVNQSINRLRDAYKQGTSFSVTDLFKGLVEAGNKSAEGLLDALKKKLNGARVLAAKASQLAAAGFSQTFIEQVVAAGPEVGTELADSILNATPETIKELQATFVAMENQTDKGLDQLANAMNTGANLATEELNKAYKTAQAELGEFLVVQAEEYMAAQAEINKEFNEQMAEAERTRDEALVSAANDLKEALAAIDREFQERIAEINKDLAAALADAAKDLADATEEARKELADTLDAIKKEFDEKLGSIKSNIASTMTAIANLKAAIASAQAAAANTAVTTTTVTTKPVTPSSVNTTTLAGIKAASGNTNINVTGVNLTSPQETANQIQYAIKYGQVVQIAPGTATTGMLAVRTGYGTAVFE